jgi:hypothetical protein
LWRNNRFGPVRARCRLSRFSDDATKQRADHGVKRDAVAPVPSAFAF